MKLANEVKAIWKVADADGRDLSPAERMQVQTRIEHIEQLRDAKAIGARLGVQGGVVRKVGMASPNRP
jgi:hypothetical protein